MRAHQIMTRPVITVTPDATILEAANTMLQHHVSGLPVVDAAGKLVGIVSEGDFIRRSEIGTQRKRSRWLRFLLWRRRNRLRSRARPQGLRGHDRGNRSLSPRMRRWRKSCTSMETNGIKRLPVMRGAKLVGIVSRANLLQAVASLAHEIPDPTADDDHIRNRIIQVLEKHDWSPFGLNVIVRDGIVHLSGVITDENSRQAAKVAAENVSGVKKVHDHLCWVDTMSGMYLESPEDVEMAKPG